MLNMMLPKVSQDELNYGLYTAVEFGYASVVELLLKAGANANFEVQSEHCELGIEFLVYPSDFMFTFSPPSLC